MIKTEYYCDGSVSSVSETTTGGIKHGLTKKYEGSVTRYEMYKYGLLHGETKVMLSDSKNIEIYHFGNKKSKTSYDVASGHIYGIETYIDNKTVHIRNYYENGNLASEQRKVNYELDGLCRWWNEDGKLRAIETLKNGIVIGLSKSWYRNGNKRCMINYNDNGDYHGKYETWYEDGTVKKTCEYRNGKPIIDCKTYYPSGVMSHLITKRYGTQTIKMWTKDGKLDFERYSYKNGAHKVIHYYPDGGKIVQHEKPINVKHGLYIAYSPSNAVIYRQYFMNDYAVSPDKFLNSSQSRRDFFERLSYILQLFSF